MSYLRFVYSKRAYLLGIQIEKLHISNCQKPPPFSPSHYLLKKIKKREERERESEKKRRDREIKKRRRGEAS